jgi:hypothetical protein
VPRRQRPPVPLTLIFNSRFPGFGAINGRLLTGENHERHSAEANQTRCKKAFKDIDGFTGVGLREGKLVVFLRDEQSRERFPDSFQGIEILPVVTGKISAGAAHTMEIEEVATMLGGSYSGAFLMLSALRFE